MSSAAESLLCQVRACTACADLLPHAPRPVLQFDPAARILIAGQAPGRRVHGSGIPFDDASGARLRDWMDIDADAFYDAGRIAILPMAFCYPGSGPSGDLPPRPECAPAWRRQLLAALGDLRLTLVIGAYAMDYHLPAMRGSVTERVARWRDCGPALLPLPHPSPRNNPWLCRNPWFVEELLPVLRLRVRAALD